MSGHPFETTMDENRERRYRQMVANIINNSVPQSSTESVHESRIEHSMVNNTQHSTLPTHQFYTRNPTATSTLCNTISHVPTPNASTYAPSDASVFKLPQTTRQFKMSSMKLDKLDNELSLINTGLRALDDKRVVKLLLRQIKTGILLARQQNVSNSTIPEIIGEISNMLLEFYYTGNVPRSDISLQSRMSDRPMSYAEGCGSIQMSSVPMERMLPSSQIFNLGNVPRSDMSLLSRMPDRPMSNAEGCGSIQMSSVPMERMLPSSQIFNQPTVNLHKFEATSAQAVPVPVSSRSVGQLSETSVARGRRRPLNNPKPSIVPEEFDEGDCLFNESMFAQQRDEIASKQTTFTDTSFAVPQPPKRKPTPRRRVNNSGVSKAKVETAVSEHSPAFSQSNNSSTMTLPEGARGVTRAGRQVKTPAQYWKGFESMRVDTSICANKTKGQGNKDNLNDSMTLRSSTVLNKKTPPLKNGKSSNKNTPLITIIEDNNVHSTVKKVNKSSAKKNSGKENDEIPKKKAAPKKKSVPKKNDVIIEDKATSSKQAAASKVPKTKKQDSATREKQTISSKKRKSLETDNMAAKKKKVEEEPLDSSDIDSDDDELFGTFTYKKPTQTALQALSPNTGMTSAKKAAGGPLGKETPPCKALGMMINMSGHSAASSVTMEAPLAKGAQVVKRVTKNLEKNQKKATKKVPNKTSKKEDAETKNALEEAIKYTYTSRTPQSTLVHSMFRGNAPETDDSEDCFSDDDDADLL